MRVQEYLTCAIQNIQVLIAHVAKAEESRCGKDDRSTKSYDKGIWAYHFRYCKRPTYHEQLLCGFFPSTSILLKSSLGNSPHTVGLFKSAGRVRASIMSY